MVQRFTNFVRGLATNWIGSLGVALTTTAFVLFIIVEMLRLLGIVTSSYVGLITYMALPLLFVIGLLLIPLAWARYRKETGKTTRQLLEERFSPEDIRGEPLGAPLLRTFVVLTIVNILFLGGGTARMLHFMEEPVFCGTACHGIMEPEWTTYQDSPHARVRCVDCHVGEGAQALIDSKINGLKQIISATFKTYPTPIPTPVHQLRPARETCERCHWPDKFYGDRLVEITHYAMDEQNTPRYTTLSLKVGSGKGERRGEIHWHVAAENEVRYASVADEREEIIWVEVRRPDGTYHRYRNRNLDVTDQVAARSVRVMDCVDCHNRATHIFEDPEWAVDLRITEGLIDRSIPFIKQQALAAITGDYPDLESAMRGIENQLNGWYQRYDRKVWVEKGEAIDRAVKVLQEVYRRNIHPRMNVGWNVHPDHLGHRGGGGCFRCHNKDMVDEEGAAVPYDCTLCHSILAQDSEHPFQYLLPAPEKGDPDARLHEYLGGEFLHSLD